MEKQMLYTNKQIYVKTAGGNIINYVTTLKWGFFGHNISQVKIARGSGSHGKCNLGQPKKGWKDNLH